MIDLIKISCQISGVIKYLLTLSQDNFIIKSQCYHWVTYTTKTGIDIKFPRYKKKEEDKVLISFSPHKQKNGNKHNADFFSLFEAQKYIESTLRSLGIERKDFIYWDISAIEIGINYQSVISPQTILECFLFYGNARFHQHHIYKHFYYAEGKDSVKGKRNETVIRKTGESRRNKYCKIKNYWKARQRNNETNLMFYELGYCGANVMRFEVKAEIKKKVKTLGFNTLESLYDKDSLNRCIKCLNKHLQEIFVFNPKDIVEPRKLRTTTECKHFFQSTAKGFWNDKEPRDLREAKKKWLKLPRKTDTKEIVIAEILKAAQDQNSIGKGIKSMSYFHTEESESEVAETPLYRGLTLLKNKRLLIDIGNTTHFCVVTGEDISMQRNGEPYLKREGLRFLKSNNTFRYNKIKEKFLSLKLLNASEEKQIENIEKNIKNRIYNEQHNNISFQRRNYHPNQTQIKF